MRRCERSLAAIYLRLTWIYIKKHIAIQGEYISLLFVYPSIGVHVASLPLLIYIFCDERTDSTHSGYVCAVTSLWKKKDFLHDSHTVFDKHERGKKSTYVNSFCLNRWLFFVDFKQQRFFAYFLNLLLCNYSGGCAHCVVCIEPFIGIRSQTDNG